MLGALGGGPQDPAGLKAKLGGAVRNLGEAGKKRGMTTTLPLALGQLQAQGSILRQPVGRVIGLWEYDPEAQAIAWASFVEPTAELRAEVERTQAFVRDQLGDARSFSLDSPEKRRPRIAALRQARV